MVVTSAGGQRLWTMSRLQPAPTPIYRFPTGFQQKQNTTLPLHREWVPSPAIWTHLGKFWFTALFCFLSSPDSFLLRLYVLLNTENIFAILITYYMIPNKREETWASSLISLHETEILCEFYYVLLRYFAIAEKYWLSEYSLLPCVVQDVGLKDILKS